MLYRAGNYQGLGERKAAGLYTRLFRQVNGGFFPSAPVSPSPGAVILRYGLDEAQKEKANRLSFAFPSDAAPGLRFIKSR
jgi:hypothetical protein